MPPLKNRSRGVSTGSGSDRGFALCGTTPTFLLRISFPSELTAHGCTEIREARPTGTTMCSVLHIIHLEHCNQISMARMKHEPVHLPAIRRESIVKAVSETCEIRGWYLWTVNVRTNHVHTVVSAPQATADAVLTAFKANATRKMRENDCWPFDHSPWARKGSKRRLWNERSIARAVDYVMNGQGEDLPDFD